MFNSYFFPATSQTYSEKLLNKNMRKLFKHKYRTNKANSVTDDAGVTRNVQIEKIDLYKILNIHACRLCR